MIYIPFALTTTRNDNRAVAEQMAAAGKDAKAIWLATGWERGADKKWRFEIDDVSLDADFLKTVDKKSGLFEALADNKARTDLFAAYPALKDFSIMREPLEDREGGNFDAANKIITLNSKHNSDFNMDFLVHEIQHFIQEKEGFAKGSSRELAKGYVNGLLGGLVRFIQQHPNTKGGITKFLSRVRPCMAQSALFQRGEVARPVAAGTFH
jgi:hypothetical protein